MELLRSVHLLLFLAQIWERPLLGTTNPVSESEKYESDDFQLKNLCDGIENDQDKEKCIQCFIKIADPEDEMAVVRCIHNLPHKVADCVKTMVNPNSEKNFEKCRPNKESEEMEKLEREELVQVDNETIAEAARHLRILDNLWYEFNTTLSLRSLLEYIEETNDEEFQKFKTVIDTCEKEVEAAVEAVQNDDEVVETEKSSEALKDKSNDTHTGQSKEEDPKSKRDAEDDEEGRAIRFCDRDAAHIHQITECILKNVIETPELMESLRMHILQVKSPIPFQIVRVLLQERDE